MYSKKRKYGRSNLNLKKNKNWVYQTYTYWNSKSGKKELKTKYIGEVGKKELDTQRRMWDDFFDGEDYSFKNQNPFNKPPTPLSKIKQYWIEDCEKKVKLGDMSNTTLRFNRENINIFFNWYIPLYGDKSIDKISTTEIDEFRSHRIQKNLSPNTVSINLRTIRGFLNYCVKEKYIDVSPFTSEIRLPKYQSRLTDEVMLNGDWKRFYTVIEKSINPKSSRPKDLQWNKNKEGDFLLDWYSQNWFKGIIWFMVNSGMRGGEVRILKWKKGKEDFVHKKVSYSYFNKEMTEIVIFFKGKEGIIPIPPKLKSFVKALHKTKGKNSYVFQNPNGGVYGKDIFNKYFRELMKAFGWDDNGYKPHSIRHSVVSDLIAKGVNLYSISKLLRHTDIRTTINIYGHLLPTDLEDIMKKIGV